jgi:F0F1-type ATP synthase assembly protein I
MDKPVKKPWKQYGRYGSLGIELILSMAVGYYVGRWIDTKAGTTPWLSLVGFLIGIYAGFRQIFRVAKRMTAEAEREDEEAQRPRDP